MPPAASAVLPDFTGKTVIITGASSGIGKEAARALVNVGASVVLAVRDQGRGEAAAAELSGPGPVTGTVEVRALDLASLASVRAFAAAWDGAPVELLINNAGVMTPPLSRTADGFEVQFGTNHLGHFALTNLLLPAIAGRVVTVASGAHMSAPGIDFDDPNWERKPYKPWPAYAQSKLANLLFTSELQRRLTEAGSPVIATAAHPGYASTNLQSHVYSPVMRFLMQNIANHVIAQSAAGGARPTLYAATADVPGDSYAGPGFLGFRGAPILVSRSKRAQDKQAAARLWTLSEQLTGITFPELQAS
jgi:NAD(P)-dependent dehydrogenase (short-subunit alcohol dehydrogenase family)